ncbi:MAG: sensor domain-containing protein [Dehalococcoidia bacterium]|nr:sensor domain-containing protein [Dehalococcoidia bacterium]
MINSINSYLAALRQELAGQDPATIQDALSDAEEYLSIALETSRKTRSDMPQDAAFAEIIGYYGSPAEVAAAYRRSVPVSAPAGVPIAGTRHWLVRFFGIVADPRMWGSMLYLLLSLGTGIFYFTWVVTGISLSAGLAVLIIGAPFFVLFLLSVRGLAWVEGRIVEGLLGPRMPRRAPYSSGSNGFWQRLKTLFIDRYTWLSSIYMILMLPLGVAYFSALVTLLASSVWGVAQPVAQLMGYSLSSTMNGPVTVMGFTVSSTASGAVMFHSWLLPLFFISGILLFFVTLHLVKLMGRLHAALAKLMLVRA